MSLGVSWPPCSGFSSPISFLKQAHFPFPLDSDAVLTLCVFKNAHLPNIPVSFCFLFSLVLSRVSENYSSFWRCTLLCLPYFESLSICLPQSVSVYLPLQIRGQKTMAFHPVLPLTKSYTSYTCMTTLMFILYSAPFILLQNWVLAQRLCFP